MRTMTTLDAQNHFGELIDASQIEPVLITRQGLPVSVVLSTTGNTANTILQVMKLMRELSPLKGDAAAAAYEAFRQKAGNEAENDGLNEEAINELVHVYR